MPEDNLVTTKRTNIPTIRKGSNVDYNYDTVKINKTIDVKTKYK